MSTVSVVEARKYFSELMARVAYTGQRIVVKRKGKPMIALISMADLHRLEELGEEDNSKRARREAALALADTAREQIRAERSGAPLPDSAEVLDELRDKRVQEHADLR